MVPRPRFEPAAEPVGYSLDQEMQALFLAVARIPRGKAHTVLVAATSEGDFVLDNLKSAVMPWRRLPYAWKIRQSAAAPARWYIIPRG